MDRKNIVDTAHSISRIISEGYCRRSLKESFNHLNIALGSCGECHSCYESFKQASQITDKEYEKSCIFNPRFHHSNIPLFHEYSIIPTFHYSMIPSFHYSIIPSLNTHFSFDIPE